MSTHFKSFDLRHTEIANRNLFNQNPQHERKNAKFDHEHKKHLFFFDTNRICNLDKSPALKKETLKSIGSFMSNYSKLLPKP